MNMGGRGVEPLGELHSPSATKGKGQRETEEPRLVLSIK